MKKGWIAIGVIVAVLIILGTTVAGMYNGLVADSENVNSKWSQINTQLQRRSDLIPNLVQTVKGYAAHESKVLANIADARARLAGAQTPAQAAEANTALNGALSRLLVVVENYPNLKADANYRSLMDELSGTENRIAVARMDYNTAVQAYNTKLKTFPRAMFAGMFGFAPKGYFQAQQGTQNAPKVDFGTSQQ